MKYTKKEAWKDIPGWEGVYQASTKGAIRSLNRYVVTKGGKSWYIKGKVLKNRVASNGYSRIVLHTKIKKRETYVHQLIAETFLMRDYKSKKLTVNHINNVKTDNRISNLEVVTQSQNIIHSINKGNRVVAMGQSHYASKFTQKEVNSIKKIYDSGFVMQKDLADMLNVSRTCICNIINGRTWRNTNHKNK